MESPKNKMKSSGRGFTLIELLLALLIVAFAVTALLSLFISSMFLNMANSNLTTAISHAQHVLEKIKNIDFFYIQNNTWNNTMITSEDLNPMDSEYIDITVTPSGSYTKDVVATVYWKDRGIINRNIAFETLITGQ